VQLQFRSGDVTLLLDGRVVELFRATSEGSTRYHVDHVRMEITPAKKGDGWQVRYGIDLSGMITGGGKFIVPLAQADELQRFIEAARAARTSG
jgi:hypothetical protein